MLSPRAKQGCYQQEGWKNRELQHFLGKHGQKQYHHGQGNINGQKHIKHPAGMGSMIRVIMPSTPKAVNTSK